MYSRRSIQIFCDVRLAMAMRSKSASERKCTSRFKEWSKETVITRATWSKSRTSRSKIREQKEFLSHLNHFLMLLASSQSGH
ncbi:Chaperone protein ClpB [Trichinella spiralis]|uniref:Chaperone protein ClpB n=1 Tax=Trichinella spiralis TaxID=6334 RepID=A0ABR3K529_TRISP